MTEQAKRNLTAYTEVIELLKTKNNDEIITASEMLAAKIIAIAATETGIDTAFNKFMADVKDIMTIMMEESK